MNNLLLNLSLFSMITMVLFSMPVTSAHGLETGDPPPPSPEAELVVSGTVIHATNGESEAMLG